MGAGPTMSIFEGSTFCICDELGDIGSGGTSGFFHDDVRFLSLLRLTIEGARPLPLASRSLEARAAVFYLRAPLTSDRREGTVLVARERVVGAGMEERIVVRNETPDEVSLELALELGADFADIFTVKQHDPTLTLPPTPDAIPTPSPPAPERDEPGGQLLFRDASTPGYATRIGLSEAGEIDGARVRYFVVVRPRAEWSLAIDVRPSSADRPTRSTRVRDRPNAQRDDDPRLRASRQQLQLAFERSLADLAALRLRHEGPAHGLPAAGMPWFMTLFGRDTIITALQTMTLGPELAEAALRALAELQATGDDAGIDAEPGKIVHELRRGKAARSWFERYYGTVDATPLYLILLSELWRWTGDRGPIEELRDAALLALAWIDDHGDQDGDGFVEYRRRSDRGLENQSWKDSDASQRFGDGRRAEPPIAPCEVQGYVYDAKRRTAELARDVWDDPVLAERLEREATDLKRRFDDTFWIDARGGYYALALDAAKEPVDSLCSNIGHLLWSGIVPDERVAAVVSQLVSAPLWSGWGVRTMSKDDAAYDPLAYHNGSVWPHDNSLVAHGLARCGRRAELELVAGRVLEAAAHFDHRLPEVFAGLGRDEAPFPVPYPSSGAPQAWAAATPVLLLQLLLGLAPDHETRMLRSSSPALPAWLGELELTGLRAFGARWDVVVRDGAVAVSRR